MTTPPTRPAGTTIAALAAIAIMAVAPGASAAETKTPRTMTLTGSGKVSAPPDMARITTGVVVEGSTARQALSANNAAMAKVIAGLKAQGIAEKDIQTSNFNVGPQYKHYKDGRPPKIRGYRVSNQVAVVVREIAKLGETLDAVVSLGSNSINGIQFSISDPQELQDEARRRAVADARRKAELYAKAAGVSLGPILQLSESGGFRPQPLQYARAAKFEAADAVPVQAGEQTLRMQVSITWTIE